MHVSQTFAEVIRGACAGLSTVRYKNCRERLNLTSADLGALGRVVVELNAKLIGRKKKKT